jgi:anaphase-promoting complex subunit 3
MSVTTSIGFLYYFGRQYDLAIQEAEKALELDPDFHWAHDVIGLAYLQKNEIEQALASFQKAVSLSESSVDYKCHLAQAHARTDRVEEAQNVLDMLLQEQMTNHVPLHEIALLYHALGQEDRALEFLERASTAQSFIVNTSNRDPRWDVFRMDPKFTEVLEEIGAEE